MHLQQTYEMFLVFTLVLTPPVLISTNTAQIYKRIKHIYVFILTVKLMNTICNALPVQ